MFVADDGLFVTSSLSALLSGLSVNDFESLFDGELENLTPEFWFDGSKWGTSWDMLIMADILLAEGEAVISLWLSDDLFAESFEVGLSDGGSISKEFLYLKT